MLTPGSRTRYRLTRLRYGKTLFLGEGELVLAIVAVAVRLVTLPLFAVIDLILWPVARLTVARGPWFVVAVRFDGVDARFDRIAEASTRDDALRRLHALRRPRP
jgi:hypothetical protein